MKAPLLVLCALMIAGCSTAAAPQPSSRTSQKPADAANAVTPLELDVATKYCAAENRSAVIALANGAAFWTAFPKAGEAPELDRVDKGLIAVVYETGWPGAVFTLPGTQPETPAPGTWDVCVETADGSHAIGGSQPYIVYGSIPADGSLVEIVR